MSGDRAYTAKEINALHDVCRARRLYGTAFLPSGYSYTSRAYIERDLDAAVEEDVHTCVSAGITAGDILREDHGKLPFNAHAPRANVPSPGKPSRHPQSKRGRVEDGAGPELPARVLKRLAELGKRRGWKSN